MRYKNIIPPEVLIKAYCNGIFPMADAKTGEIRWYYYDPRGILELTEFRISRSLRQTVRKNLYEIRIDSDCEAVIRGCSKRKDSWISETIVQSYLNLFKLGYVHSVESYQNGKLAGGLYGVAIKSAFFGESMFTILPNASKVALVHLIDRLRSRGYQLLDTQMVTEHLSRFGAKEIPQKEYLIRLKKALEVDCSFI